MSTSRTAVEVTLPDGRAVILVRLRSGEMLNVMKAAGEYGSDGAQNLASTLEGLRQSLRRIGTRAVGYAELQGELLDEHFGFDELTLLGSAWSQLHFPTQATAREVVGNVRVVAFGGTGA